MLLFIYSVLISTGNNYVLFGGGKEGGRKGRGRRGRGEEGERRREEGEGRAEISYLGTRQVHFDTRYCYLTARHNPAYPTALTLCLNTADGSTKEG